MGWLIPAEAQDKTNSDLPGDIRAIVRTNVFDTATGKYLLIPQGSRLFGTYDSHVGYGQSRVQAIWKRLIFPDGSDLDLEGMASADAQGAAGLHGHVDNHYRRLVGFALLTSAFYAGSALSQSRRGSVLGYPTAQETASTAASNNMSQEMTEILRRNMNIPPTITVPPGTMFNVVVNEDIIMDGPYRPLPPM
jgi:type IV secretion system protein VirB10